ncbi:MAG: hypothetical protein NXI32_26290 [bacterium]|nr:hypothetical protein [bacterium]
MCNQRKHLPRLDPKFYQGKACVHWTLTIEQRKKGWLNPIFLNRFRELMTHALFRYALVCPIYCLMPDHMHLVWIGIEERSDQLKAMKFFRRQLNASLGCHGFRFQHQPYDRVLRDEERKEENFVDLVEYIGRNPERAGLIEIDEFTSYPYNGCLLPGYPELQLWTDQFWDRFWRAYAFLRKQGLFRPAGEEAM